MEGGLGAGLAFLGGTGGGGMTSSLLLTLGEAPGDISGLLDPWWREKEKQLVNIR